jgi:hypothetical protein
MLSKLTSAELIAKTQSLVTEERRITLELIDALREIERRMIFAELGYGSLYEFATRHLGLSEGSAQRRIQAMRLIRDIPDARDKLEAGELSLSNAAKVQTFWRDERLRGRTHDKAAIITQVSGLSQRDCERKLHEISPRAVPDESVRIVSPTERELRIVVDEALYQKLERIRGLLAHASPGVNLAGLLDVMADLALARLERRRGLGEARPEQKRAERGQQGWGLLQEQPELTPSEPKQSDSNHTAAVQTKKLPSGKRVALPRALQRQVWAKAQGRCEYSHQGQRCESRYRLEIDHRTPLALGGSNDPSNLRLLCRTHNQYEAHVRGVGLNA